MKMYLFAVIWLEFLWILDLITAIKFTRVVNRAGYWQIPYLIRCSFALYLSIGIYLMN
ncbi:MAG: tryptophan-rich sensory protein [Clostridia bacterium]|nr:tryptophan-rich sensory protein [Clostridia bacterium]